MQNMYTICKKIARKLQVSDYLYLDFIFSFEMSIMTQNNLKHFIMKKMNFKTAKEGLTRNEMRSIMAGSGSGGCSFGDSCSVYASGQNYYGQCGNLLGTYACYCVTSYGYYGGGSKCAYK